MNMEERSSFRTSVGSFLLGLGLTLALYFLAYGHLGLWRPDLKLVASARPGLLIAAIFSIAGLALCLLRGAVRPDPIPFIAAVIILPLTDVLDRPFNFLQGPWIRGEILLFALLFLVPGLRTSNRLSVLLGVIPPVLLTACFFIESNGRLIFSDDHATFMYRLTQLKENFPTIPYYSPAWNGGFDARDFLATGALNIFAITSPLLYLFPVESVYNVVLVMILFGLTPLSCSLAARLAGLPKPAPAVAAALGLTTSLTWYKWALHYGTMGFVTSVALSPLVLVLGVIALQRDRELSFLQAVALVVTGTLLLFWSPSGIAFLPLLALGLYGFPRLIRKRRILAVLSALVAINLPWMLLFWSSANVGGYLTTKKPTRVVVATASAPKATEQAKPKKSILQRLDVQHSLKIFREQTGSSQPLLLFLFLPGILFLKRGWRLPSALYLGWLLVAGTLAVPLIPQLDLDRMLVFFLFGATLPCAALLGACFQQSERSGGPIAILPALLFGMIAASVLSAGAIVRNRSVVRYTFEQPIVQEISDAIRQHSRGGRILFSGFILHELNNAHIAPLPYFTNVPLIASSHVHRYWRYTEVFPVEYLRRTNEGGIEEYLDLYNVSAVVSHEPKWRRYFESRPEEYRLAWRNGRFSLFERRGFPNTYLLSGAGAVLEQTSNSVTARVDSEEAVLKFNYFPFLTSSSCNLEPYPVGDSMTFVRLTGCTPGTAVTIRSAPPLTRIRL